MYQLRLANQADKEKILKVTMDSKYRQCYRHAPASGYSEDTLINMFQTEIEGAKDTNGIYVLENEEKEIIGACSFYFTFHRNGYTFIRFYISNHVSKLVETELFDMILKLCFLDLNYNKINIELRASQLKYVEVFRKSGFTQELRLREHYYSNGRYEDMIQLGLNNKEYRNKTICEEYELYESNIVDEDYLLEPNMEPNKQLLMGENIDLTEFTTEDEPVLYEACKNSDYMHYACLSAPGPTSYSQGQELTRHENNYMSFQKGIIFAIRNKEGKVVGTIGSNMLDHRNRNLMIGLEVFHSKERGKGYGSEAIRLFTDYAFLEMNMHRVYLGCFEFNSQAGYLYERLGFKPEGINRDFVYRNGRYYSEKAFGVVKKDWLALRGYL